MLKIQKIKPMATRLVVTGEKFTEDMYDEHGIIESKKGDLKTYQKVLEVGPMVRDVKPGDMVMINFMHYAVMQYDPNSLKGDMGMNKVKEFRFNRVDLYDENGDSQECLYIDQQDIIFAFEGDEVQGCKKPIILPKDKEIMLN